MIRAIIFDCFGVLYTDSSRHFYEHSIPNYEQLWPQLMDLNKEADYGLITRDEHIDAIAELTGSDRMFVAQNISGVHKRNQHLLEYIESLRPRFQIGMCSNIGPGGLDAYFSLEEREQLFDTVVTSGEEGITKPNPAIFQLTAARLGVEPNECVMIDDIEENCSGADAAGMRAIQYVTNAQIQRDLARLITEVA